MPRVPEARTRPEATVRHSSSRYYLAVLAVLALPAASRGVAVQSAPGPAPNASGALARLSDRKASIRLQAIQELKDSPDPRVAEALVATGRDDKEREVRVAALHAIGERDADKIAEVLATIASRDPDDRIRASAVFALGRMPTGAVTGALLRALRDKSTRVQVEAIGGIADRDGVDVETALGDAVESDNTDIRAAAERALLRRRIKRAPLAIWDVHSSVLFDEAYIGSPLGTAGMFDLSSRLTRSILGARSVPLMVTLLRDVPTRRLVDDRFIAAVARSVAQPLVQLERPTHDLPEAATCGFEKLAVDFRTLLRGSSSVRMSARR